jgi:hypothetical protein
MSNNVINQLRTYLEYASNESEEETLAVAPWVEPVVRWYQRGPVLAVLVALVVLAVGVPALLLSSDTAPLLGSNLPDPMDVGVERVWPDAGFRGSPNDIAAEFAEEALGWTNVEVVSDPDASVDGPVWTTITHAGSADLELLSIPIGDGRRVLMQVGSSGMTVGPADKGGGQRIGIPRVPGAASAILHMRFVEPDRVDVIRASASDLEQGQVAVASDSPIGGIVVVYLDESGEGLTAIGGHFGPLDVTVAFPVDASHAAVAFHALGSVEEVSVVADERGIDFACGTFAVPGESGTETSACLVSDGGLVAVIALDPIDGLEYFLSGAGLDAEVSVPVDETDVYGVEAPGQVTLSVKIRDTVIGTVTSGS